MEGLFDVSSCLLFEASGDSEAEFSDAAVEEELGPKVAEDDAHSCSRGRFSGSVTVHEIDAGGDDFYTADIDDYIEEEEEDDDGSSDSATEVEDGVVDQCCGGSKAAAAAREDPNMKLMNEGETDRLFWEACLGS